MIYAWSETIARALVRLSSAHRMGSCDCLIRDNRLVVGAKLKNSEPKSKHWNQKAFLVH
jgi:hypothetical protein